MLPGSKSVHTYTHLPLSEEGWWSQSQIRGLSLRKLPVRSSAVTRLASVAPGKVCRGNLARLWQAQALLTTGDNNEAVPLLKEYCLRRSPKTTTSSARVARTP